MAKYPAVITTMAGTNIIAEANASKQALIFTKIVIGAGDMPASIPRCYGVDLISAWNWRLLKALRRAMANSWCRGYSRIKTLKPVFMHEK